MPILVLAGLPFYSLRKRDTEFEGYFATRFPSWDARLVWSSKKADLNECWDDLQAIIAEVEGADETSPCGGLHLLAFHSNVDSRQQYRDRMRPSHRLRFLDTTLISTWGQQPFREAIDGAVAFEECWRDKLRPPARSHPLLLPDQHFKTTEIFGQLWRRSCSPQSEDDIVDIAGSISAFDTRHRVGNEFHDLDGNRFQYNGACHAAASGRENWKFVYRMPDGFHYDVQPPLGKHQVTVSGVTYDRYVNAYPYGMLRGNEI